MPELEGKMSYRWLTTLAIDQQKLGATPMDIENNHKVKGTLLAILLGQEKQLKNAFSFEALSDVTENERNILYQ